jgi:tRNA1Val (adenine37-N6)-methyltransferase
MKVGTDGVLLGAWVECAQAKTILDIGTGSGLIALMLAQRCPNAFVQAIDIDENAYNQAKINFAKSIFHPQLHLKKMAFQDFSPSEKQDLIVCNPPYFSRSLKSPDESRTYARHNDSLPFADLIEKSAFLLNRQGKLALILPFDDFENINSLTIKNHLFLCRKTNVSANPSKPPKRVLLEYSPLESETTYNHLCLENERHFRSDEYAALVENFYLQAD